MIHVLRETHEAPAEIARILREGGGLNPFSEPNYRLVWGQSRLDFVGGLWEDRNDAGDLIRETIEVRHVPKYAVDRWIIERWMPAETYGPPALWEMETFERAGGQIVPALGPYPYRGDYELAFKCETTSGEFVQMTPQIARAFVAILETSRETTSVSRTEKISKEQARQDREYDNYADTVLNDGPAFHDAPFVSVL